MNEQWDDKQLSSTKGNRFPESRENIRLEFERNS